MFACHPAPWKRTIGIHLAFGKGVSSERKNEKGLTHIAEHLCFSGTDTLSAETLSENIGKYFWHLDAITSGERVRFCCLAERRYFNEAVDTLRQMVFSWKCAEAQWGKEKSELVEEAEEYGRSEEKTSLPRKNALLKNVISLCESQLSPEETAVLGIETVSRAKTFWEGVMRKAPRSLTLMGEVSPSMEDHARHILFSDAHESTDTPAPDPNPDREWGFAHHEGMSAFWRKSAAPHFFALLLNEIFLSRSPDIEFVQTRDASAWVVNGAGKSRRQGLGEEIFCHPITEGEFTLARSLLLRFWDRCLDGIGGETSLEWLSRFTEGQYSPLFSPDSEAYRQILKDLSFQEFREFCRGMAMT